MSKLFDNPNEKEENGKLPEKVAEIFEPVKCHPGPAIWKGAKLDTTKITVDQAHQLVKEGFDFLKYKEGKGPKPADAEKEKAKS